jgi:26S proteasome regulatory subunit N2
LIQSRELRQQLLRLLISQYLKLGIPDYISVCQCLVFLDDSTAVAENLRKLIETDSLMAYQIGFELYQNAPQGFLNTVAQQLR